MIKILSALAIASVAFAMPAAAQDVKAPTASVVPPVSLPSNGLAAAGAAAGVAVLAVVAVAFIANDDDDNVVTTTTTTGAN